MEEMNLPDSIIARREYELDGREGAVIFTIFVPASDARGQDWCCRYRIEGLPSRPDRHAYGVDAVQALDLALKNAAMFLYATPEAREGRLTWLDQGRGKLGLPIPDGMEEWYRD